MNEASKAAEIEFDHPFWGHENPHDPARGEFIATSEDRLYPCQMTLEDFFQHNGVFVNGISGRRSHSDSYMTSVEFKALDKALNLLSDKFQPTKEEWAAMANRWIHGLNMQQPLILVGLIILTERAGLPIPERKKNEE